MHKNSANNAGLVVVMYLRGNMFKMFASFVDKFHVVDFSYCPVDIIIDCSHDGEFCR